MRVIALVGMTLLLGVLGVQLYRLNDQRAEMEGRVSLLRGERETLARENEEVIRTIEYLSNPRNLLKELKSLFNYRSPGEELYIIVPKEVAE